MEIVSGPFGVLRHQVLAVDGQAAGVGGNRQWTLRGIETLTYSLSVQLRPSRVEIVSGPFGVLRHFGRGLPGVADAKWKSSVDPSGY